MPLVKVVVVALLHAAVGVGDGGCIAAGCAVGASERACVAACCLVVPGEGAVRWVRLREAALLNPASSLSLPSHAHNQAQARRHAARNVQVSKPR